MTSGARIGFDARALEPGFKAHFGRGTGRYATELLAHLQLATDSNLAILPLGSAQLGAQGWQQSLLQALPAGRQTVETQLFLPRRLERLPVDLLHFMAHGDATARCRKPYIVTVLDLIPLRFPELYRAKKSNWRFHLARSLEHQAIRSAAGIIAISEATKRDVVSLLGINPEKIIVTPLGVRSDFAPRPLDPAAWDGATETVRSRYGLPPGRPILLYVGGIDPRKNVPFMLKVIASLKEILPPQSRPVLVLAGRHESDDQYPALLEVRKQLGLEDDVRLLGFVPDSDILDLYRASRVKLFPSLYEGFGLPVLEAMALGVPVIAGDNSSIPEVASGAAVLLDVCDVAGWVHELQSLLADEGRQRELSVLGIARAAAFTWERTASQTLAAYRHFLGQPAAAHNVRRAVS